MNTLPQKIQQEIEEYIHRHHITGERRERLIELVKQIYHKFSYDAQEPIGVVTAQSLSEPATQMSTSPYERIIMKRNDIINIIEIGKFVDSIVEKLGKNIDGWDVCDTSSEKIYVPSITDKEKIEWHVVKAVSRHKAPERLLKITTFSGRQITATDSHSFVIRKDNKIVPISGSDLDIGDRIPVIKYLPEHCINEVTVSMYIPRQLKEDSGFLHTTNKSKPVPNKLNLDFHSGWFIGAYLSEGSSQGSQIGISNIDDSFISNAKIFAEKIGLDFKDRTYIGEFGMGRTFTINSTILAEFIISICGKGAKNKRVPNFAYTANEEFVSGLLRGYFDGYGNIHPDRNIIRISSNSKELLDGICLLLARFGIFAYKVKNKNQHGLLIPYKYAPLFLEKIGSDISKKKENLKRMADNAKNYWENKSQDFTDMISGFGDIFYIAAKKLNYPTRCVNNFTNRQRIGRTTLYRYIDLFEKKASEKNVDISPELQIMRIMYSSDVIWDKIVSIESIKPDFEYVYDLTVEGTETFTTFDGIITHNTMRTYHFAGTAGIQVTLGLPRMLEIFDARKEPRTPTMTVYIDKDCQDLDNVKKIGEQIKEVKVKDVVLSTVIDMTDLFIQCQLDMAKVKEFEIDLEKLEKMIKIKNSKVSVEKNSLYIYTKKGDIRNLHKIKYTLLESHVKGIRGVTQVVIMKENDEWVINTLGSNLKKVFEIIGVDATRTTCNNMFEILNVLGVEAARNVIINQAKYTMEEQGLGVDLRYITLLADLMTSDGEIKPIGRYGISGQKASFLVRASFEETKKHLTNSAIIGERDTLKGTIENIIMNQVAPIGTGVYELIGRIPEVPKEILEALPVEEKPKRAKIAVRQKKAKK